MKKIKGLLLMMCILGMTACVPQNEIDNNKTAVEPIVTADTKEVEDEQNNSLITVEELRSIYSIDGEIPDDYIKSYIEFYNITYADEAKKRVNYKSWIESDYRNNEVIPSSIIRKKRGEFSEKPLDEFVQNTQYICIDFVEIIRGSELQKFETFVIDFDKMEAYFGGQINSYDVPEGVVLKAQITDDIKNGIMDEISTHINENPSYNEDKDIPSYSFDIWFIDQNGDYIGYKGTETDELNFPGFDEYWKGLYKEIYGEEFEFSN